jgi:hypothetical protein
MKKPRRVRGFFYFCRTFAVAIIVGLETVIPGECGNPWTG